MKIISLTVISAGHALRPSVIDLLDTCPGGNIVAMPSSIHAPGTWLALGRSDILLLDEAVIACDGAAAVRTIHACYPALRTLLLVDHDHDDRVQAAFSLGVHGVMLRTTVLARLWQAITMLYESSTMTPEKNRHRSCEPLENRDHEVVQAPFCRIPDAWNKLH